jgi:hypothetical protein
MKLSEFKRQIESDITIFTEYWLEQNVLNAREWPLEMNEGDWYDHFLMSLHETKP